MRNTLAFLLSLLAFSSAKSQGNDNFSSASLIAISNNNYAFENISSTKSDLSNATIEGPEFIASLATNQALNDKSVWYYFYIPTARSVAITVKQQDTLIAQNHVGLSVYRNPKSIPNASKLDNTLPTITKFGSTRNVCTQPGYYYIQVVANSAANANIWLELSIAPPENTICDLASKPLNFGILNGEKSQQIEFGCYSIDRDDEKLNDTTLTQSAWFVFTTDDQPDIFGFNSPSKNMFLYRGHCNNGVNALKALRRNVQELKDICDLRPNTTYSICIRLPSSYQNNNSVSIYCRGLGDPVAADPNNIANKFQLGKIDDSDGYFNLNTKEFFDCQSRPSNYNCSGLETQNDTDKIHCLITFETTKPATLDAGLRIYADKNQTKNVYFSADFKLFEGDVTKDCNLEHLQNLGNRDCIEPGIYTLQILINQQTNSFYFSTIGTVGIINLDFYFQEEQKDIVHSTPNNAEFIGKIGNKDSIAPDFLLTEADYYIERDTFYLLNNNVYYGRFIFREFYLTKANYLNLTEQHPEFGYKSFIFKGSISRNRGKLKLLTEEYGALNPFGGSRATKAFVSDCKKLEKGWYTIVSVIEEDCKKEISALQSQILINCEERTKSKFNHPYKAYFHDNLTPIDFKPNYGTAKAPRFENTITFPNDYFDCPLDTPTYNTYTCNNNLEYEQVAYYVFNIKNESYLETSDGFLYPYNVKTDSLKLLDSANLIGTCGSTADYNYYCKVQPGVYTLVVTGEARITTSPHISVSPVKYLPSNHVKQAYDLGQLKNGTTQSKGEFISCTVNEDSTDYPYYNKFRRTLKNPQRQNQYIDRYSYGNVWYTFTASNAGKVAIWFDDLNREFEIERPTVYVAEEKDTIDFSLLRFQNEIDSSTKQGLKPMALRYSRYSDTAYFFKASCKTLRYYVVIPVLYYNKNSGSNISPNYTLQANVEFTPDPLAAGKGDFCSNAIEIDLSDNDNSSNSTSISCHSIGESFGEDGSNMSCLGEIDEVKTTWFKVNYTGNLKNDLSFNLTEKTNYPPNQFKYRVLYGSCKSMTAGPCVDEINSSYRLDCMAPSTYYIQVSSPKNAIGTIELSAKSRPTQYQVCKPFDPDELLAHFIPIGGCNPNDTFFFENLSTQGDSINYSWEFGDGHTSTLKSPSHLYNTTGNKIDTFFVTLTVKNTQTLASKSVKKAVYIFKNLIFDLGPDTNNFCNRLFKPDPTLNFTPSSIQWHSDYLIDSPLILSPNLRASSNGIKYYIKVGISNCRIKDSIKIYYNYHGDREYNYDLCEGGFFQAVVRDTFPIYEWSNGAKTDSLKIDKPGSYTLKLGYTEECYATYTYNLTLKESPKIKFVGNPQCIGEILEVQPEKDGNYYYYWPHDRSNRQQTVVIDTGYIKVLATLNNCSIIDSYYVDPNKLLFPKFIDTVSCTKPLTLTENYENSRYLWSTGDTTNSISINDEGLYQVYISKGDCKISNEWDVTFSEIADLVEDNIALCDTASHTIIIDSNYTVLWFDSLTENRRIFSTEGSFWVEIKDEKCQVRNDFEIKRVDLSQISLGPDTALCPPFRIELKVPHADTIIWSNGVENEKSNYITDTGYVWVQLLQNGCFASDTLFITTLDCIAKLHVPNAFTPEGENPIFLPKGVNIEEFEMKIFNRWGERLFITNDLNIGWPGTFNGEICQMDVYVYVINYKAQNQGPKTISGGFLLLR